MKNSNLKVVIYLYNRPSLIH